jgi:hypothetical protein
MGMIPVHPLRMMPLATRANTTPSDEVKRSVGRPADRL